LNNTEVNMKTRILSAAFLTGASQLALAHGESSSENSLYHMVTSPDHVMMTVIVVVGAGLLLTHAGLRAIRQKKD
jgi:hypothetical protein